MKTKIKDFLFIADAFGPIPVWTLQDVVKGAEDAYALVPLDADKPIRGKKGAKVRDFFRRLNDVFPWAEIFIDGEVEWEDNKEMEFRSIINLVVEKVVIYPSDSGQI